MTPGMPPAAESRCGSRSKTTLPIRDRPCSMHSPRAACWLACFWGCWASAAVCSHTSHTSSSTSCMLCDLMPAAALSPALPGGLLLLLYCIGVMLLVDVIRGYAHCSVLNYVCIPWACVAVIVCQHGYRTEGAVLPQYLFEPADVLLLDSRDSLCSALQTLATTLQLCGPRERPPTFQIVRTLMMASS